MIARDAGFTIYTTPAFRAGLHRRDNRYRYNTERGAWQFDDGIGPWCNCATPLSRMNEEEGDRYLRSIDFQPGEP